MDWDSSVLKFNAAEYYEWLENMVAGMELQSMLYTKWLFKALTDATMNLLFRYNLIYNEQPTT